MDNAANADNSESANNSDNLSNTNNFYLMNLFSINPFLTQLWQFRNSFYMRAFYFKYNTLSVAKLCLHNRVKRPKKDKNRINCLCI